MPEYRKFIEIIADVLAMEPKEIPANARFTEDLGADSLMVYRIMVTAMKLFDMDISDEDVSEVETVGDAYHLFHPAVE